MDTLRPTLEEAMSGYTGPALNGQSHLTRSADGEILTVVSIATLGERHFADTSLVARVVDGRIVIDHTGKLDAGKLDAGKLDKIVLTAEGRYVIGMSDGETDYDLFINSLADLL